MIHIITDSTCEFNPEEQKNMNITVIPHQINFGEVSYRDNIDITREEFYEKLVTVQELPTTSQINPAEFEEVFQKVKEKDEEAVVLLITSELSGTFQSAHIATEMVDSEHIYLVDSNTGSFGLALLVKEAVKLREAGFKAKEIATKIQSLSKRIKLVAVIDTLKYLKIGGRISASSAFIGNILGIHPILEVRNGKIIAIDKVRSFKAGMRKLLEYLEKEPADLSYGLSFGHSNAKEKLDKFVDYIKASYPTNDITITNIGSAVGAHTGPGVIGISYITKE